MQASFGISSVCFIASVIRRDKHRKHIPFRLGILSLVTSVLINGALLDNLATYAITSLPFMGMAVFALWSSAAWRDDGSHG
jgi:hypothetical protein